MGNVSKIACKWFRIEGGKYKLNEHLIKNYSENSDKGYFLEVNVEYAKKCLIVIVIYHFYLKERRSKSVTSLFIPYRIKNVKHKSFKTGIEL